ncbi:MAG: hypothetical protein ISS26_01240 [Candidatus Omnitrophica bacterium]|nr:hypothetical protein [Candidatus Omnitrophota bacterium]
MVRVRAPLIYIFVISLSLLLLSLPAFAQPFGVYGPEGNVEDWVVIESSYATIFVDKDIRIKDVTERIDVSFARYDPIEKQLFLDKGTSPEEKLATKIDIIIRKAKKILDMHPHDFHVKIRVYGSGDEMWDIYEYIFKERREYKAFYIHGFDTVYIPVEYVTESILAHELAHSIIDTYFKTLPPEKIRELLACYVDVHLKD